MPLLERPSPTPGPRGHQLPAWLANLFFSWESSASASGPPTQDLPPGQGHCTKKANLVPFQRLTVGVGKEKGGQPESSGARSTRARFPVKEAAAGKPRNPRGQSPRDPGGLRWPGRGSRVPFLHGWATSQERHGVRTGDVAAATAAPLLFS